jgi:pyruvyl transferase EpsI
VTALQKIYLRARIRLSFLRARPDEGVRSPSSTKRHVFVMLAADYGNVGDLAITYAQVRFLERAFPDATVVPVPISRTVSALKHIRRAAQPDDVVTLIGGGNTGDMYDDIQFLRELVIRSCRRMPVISFPQTVEFSETRYGRWAHRRAAKVYGRHGRMVVMARDTRSLAVLRSTFPVRAVVLSPDVVLTVDATTPPAERQDVVVALRADMEQALDVQSQAATLELARELGPVRPRDTHVGDVRLGRQAAEETVEAYWADWRGAKVVITDRLHGTIFAVVTGTPCVVLDSGTGKVGQFCRDWLAGMASIRLVDAVTSDVLAEACEAGSNRDGALQLRARFDVAFAECLDALGVQ